MSLLRNRPSARYLTILLGSAALAGCSMTPKYVRPDLPVQAAYPSYGEVGGQMAITVPQQTHLERDWRKFFTDPVLKELIAKALVNNRDLRITALKVEEARAGYRIERAELLPSISAGADGNMQELPDELAFNRRQYRVGLFASAWEIDLWGRLRSESDAALEAYLARDATRQAAQMSLVAEVAIAYANFDADTKMLRLADRLIANLANQLTITAQLVDAGAVSRDLLETAQMDLQGAHAVREQLALVVERDRHALELLIAEPLPTGTLEALATNDGADREIAPARLAAGLPSELLTNRPDIVAAEHMLRSANANIGAARAAFFPSISLTGMVGSASADLDGLFKSGSGAWSFAPRINLPLPIFQGSALGANLDRAKIRQRIEVAAYEKSIQSAFREVADGLAGQAMIERRLLAQTRRAASVEIRRKLAEQRYTVGLDNRLAVLSAERTLIETQQDITRVRLDRTTNVINLYKALGGGWE